MSEIKILDPITQKYKITLKTGLHIWGWDWGLKIGWIDSWVVKNPLTNEPYIPWSSIKWKMRASLEMIEGDYSKKYWPTENEKWNIAKAFWMATSKIKISSRIIFSDFELTKEYKYLFWELWSVDFMEDKSENSVPRFLQWNANPRHIERVPAGVEFIWSIILTPVEWIYDISEKELNEILNKWIKYLVCFC